MHIFSGHLKNKKLVAPVGLATRPTSGRMRETFFNICQNLVEDADFLDLFAGSGAMGFEALSRGARSATFIDNSLESIRCIKDSIKALGLESVTTVIHAEVFNGIGKLQQKGMHFDLIYADPPYEHFEDLGYKVLKVLDEGILLKPTTWVYLEESAKANIPTIELSQLKLRSYRKAGRSSLYEFQTELQDS